MWGWEDAVSESGSQPSPNSKSASALIWPSPPLQLWEVISAVHKPRSVWYVVMTAWMDSDIHTVVWSTVTQSTYFSCFQCWYFLLCWGRAKILCIVLKKKVYVMSFCSHPFHSNVSLTSRRSSITTFLEDWNQKHNYTFQQYQGFVCFLHTLNSNEEM